MDLPVFDLAPRLGGAVESGTQFVILPQRQLAAGH
jgi:hypothetical protein